MVETMDERFIRSEMILGSQNLKRLCKARVAVFGLGGVGGYVAEALARTGIGGFLLVDHDTVCVSNINRQIIATDKTVGRAKVDVMRERILDINPDADVEVRECFYLPDTADEFDFSTCSYVVDAVDTVTAKLEIIMQAKACGTPVISCMGTGNKLDVSKLCVSDLYRTTTCPLARIMRHECKKRGITELKVVYSAEEPIKASDYSEEEYKAVPETENKTGKHTPGSLIFVPAAAGLMIAGEIVKDLIVAS